MTSPFDLNGFLDALAERVAQKVRAERGEASPYYTDETAPCGRNAFLVAAKAGEFPAFRRGQRVFARRADVEAWIEARPLVQRDTKPENMSPEQPRAAAAPPAPAKPTAREILAAGGAVFTNPTRKAG